MRNRKANRASVLLSTARGFTIVELLIVIVIVATLAAISVAAYTGATNRAKFSSYRATFASAKKAVELYKADKGYYPDSNQCIGVGRYEFKFCGWDQGTDDSFIPGIEYHYLRKLDNIDASLVKEDTLLYQSRAADGTNVGTDQYQLIRYRRGGLNSWELSNNPDLMTGQGYDGIGWGYRSNPAAPWW